MGQSQISIVGWRRTPLLAGLWWALAYSREMKFSGVGTLIKKKDFKTEIFREQKTLWFRWFMNFCIMA